MKMLVVGFDPDQRQPFWDLFEVRPNARKHLPGHPFLVRARELAAAKFAKTRPYAYCVDILTAAEAAEILSWAVEKAAAQEVANA